MCPHGFEISVYIKRNQIDPANESHIIYGNDFLANQNRKRHTTRNSRVDYISRRNDVMSRHCRGFKLLSPNNNLVVLLFHSQSHLLKPPKATDYGFVRDLFWALFSFSCATNKSYLVKRKSKKQKKSIEIFSLNGVTEQNQRDDDQRSRELFISI